MQTPALAEEPAASSLPVQIDSLAAGLEARLGLWASDTIAFDITWLDFLLFLSVMVVAAVLDAAARAAIRWRARRHERREQRRQTAARARAAAPAPAAELAEVEQVEAETNAWTDRLLAASRAPLSVVIWVYGLYLGSFFLLRELRVTAPDHLLFRGLDWLASLWGFIVLFWLAGRVARVVDNRLRRHAARSESRAERVLLPVAGQAGRFIAPLIVVFSALPLFAVSPGAASVVRTLASLGLIAAIAVLLARIIQAMEAAVLAEFSVQEADNLEARKIYTRVRVLRKMSLAILIIVALACMLMVFEPVRQVGASLLASAGIAGIVLGFAAQRSIATLFAGIQIALTQPIRLDDVVIVEGEWGRIEEITLTYVVVRIWDLRRLIVPISYFIEQPFQNWTRTSADILGAVFLYMDYSVPVDAVRAEVDRILHQNPRWDGKVKVVQLTDATERTVQVRILASAVDAGTAFDLRCELREKLIHFIQSNYPQSLPRFRAEADASGTTTLAASDAPERDNV